jgi:hypothetical protein
MYKKSKAEKDTTHHGCHEFKTGKKKEKHLMFLYP